MTIYAVPVGSFSFWEKRLKKFEIEFSRGKRFDEQYLAFNDPHGLRIQLVERESGKLNNWPIGDISKDVAIKGFSGAILYSSEPEATAKFLTETLGLEFVGTEEDLMRFKAPAEIGNIIDLKTVTGVRGTMGVGTVHHVAWRVKDDADQLEWKFFVKEKGFHVTPVGPELL